MLAKVHPAAIERYQQTLLAGVLMSMVAFVPALGIAALSLFVLGSEQNSLAVLYHQESTLIQSLKGPMQAEDSLMPLFILAGNQRLLDRLYQNERDFDAALAQLRTLEPPNSRAAQILGEVAILSKRRQALAGPGVTMRMQGEPIENVNHYFEQHSGHVTDDLHRSVNAFVQLIDARFESFINHQRGRLHVISTMLLAADGFAVVVCIGVSIVILRLLQTKKQHDAALVQQAEWQHALATARKEAVEVVAHDLRHPLQVMMFVAEKLQRVATADQSVRAALDAFAGSAAAMRRLIDAVLHPANIDAQTLRIAREPVDLQPILQDIITRFQLSAKAATIDLSYTSNCDLPPLIADPVRLEQVFSNLLANAIKFTPAQGRVTLTTAWAAPWAAITVADTGCGMSSEQIEQMFRRYWRGGTSPEHGSGLGLAIGHAIVDAHRGRIEVNSTPGEGTVFTIYLPVDSSASVADDARECVGAVKGFDGATHPLSRPDSA